MKTRVNAYYLNDAQYDTMEVDCIRAAVVFIM
jgi:hypothetical protein